MTRLDWIALAVVALAAFLGLRKGLVASALSAVGLVAGAIVGARLAPLFLAGDDSPYTPVVGLIGAAAGAIVLEMVASLVGAHVRAAVRGSPLGALDSAGGLAVGVAAGLAVVWVVGAAALYIPGQDDWRRAAQRSLVLRELNEIAPPERLMAAIQRADPFPAIVGPRPPDEPVDESVTRDPTVNRAARSVVRVVGTACGLAVSGSGWVAGNGLVVTAAHVVAGQRDTTVELPRGGRFGANAVRFDVRNDLAVLRVRGLDARPLPLGRGDEGASAAILGYPRGGPLKAAAGRIGETVTVLAPDAYGRGPVRRAVTTIRGDVEQGNSGGPAVDARGEVETTVFAARVGDDAGFGVPMRVVRRALARARGRVPTGPCVR